MARSESLTASSGNSLLSAEDKRRVVEAIARVEQNSAGEIVVAVIARSDDYALPRAVTALFLTVAGAWGVYLGFPMLHSAWVFALEPLLAWVVWLASGAPAVLRRLVPKAQQRLSVDQRAKWAFIHYGLTETRDRTGVLILISLGERMVQVLGDKGIYQRLGEGGFQHEVARIVGAIKQGNAADGLCAAIDSIGETLAGHFPRRADDVNELPNEVLELKI